MKLLQMSLSASIVIVLVLCARRVGRRRLHPQLFYLLWGIALLRLLVPFSVPSAAVLRPTHIPTLVEAGGLRFVGPTAPEAMPGTQSLPGAAGGTQFSTATWLCAIWLTGVVLCACCVLLPHCKRRHVYGAAIPIQTDFVLAWKAAHPLRRGYRIAVSDRIAAPMATGILRPSILLPARVCGANKEALSYMLTHEYTHIRHFHVACRVLCLAACCIHWFNPLVWLMLRFAGRDMENICDAAVIGRHGSESRRAYAMLLLTMQDAGSGPLSMALPLDRTGMTERIEMIMRKPKRRYTLLAALLLCLCTATALATSPTAGGMPIVPRDATDPAIHIESSVRNIPAATDGTAADDADIPFAVYEPFGLTYDRQTERLYYQGMPVKKFIDLKEKPEHFGDNGVPAGPWCMNVRPDGAVDVETVRDFEDGNRLIGLIVTPAEAGTYTVQQVLAASRAAAQWGAPVENPAMPQGD